MKKPKIADDIEFDSERLFDPFTGIELQINEVTAKILELCDGCLTTAEITEKLAAVYTMEPDEIHPDVKETVATLEKFKMLDTRDRSMRKVAVRVDRTYKKLVTKIMGG